MPTPAEQFAQALRLHAPEFGIELSAERIDKLQEYYSLLLKWNPRLHLVAPCSAEEFAIRHVLESLLLLRHLPLHARIADIGSGAGLPTVPCLIARDDLHAVLIESSRKKSVFLKEALSLIGVPDRTDVMNGRFEELPAPDVQFITCRALDAFIEVVPRMIDWAPSPATFLFFVGASVRKRIELSLTVKAELIPRSENRFLVIAHR
jgi:16S rRNA (guanine527-N7)-methyltransferase